MPTIFFSIVLTLIPVACMMIAAWPLLWLPRMRCALNRVGGTGCIGVGVTAMSVLAGGFLPAVADDKPAESASASPTAEAPAGEVRKAKAEADPVIESEGETIEIPPGRPQWIGSEPNMRGKIHSVAVASGPYKKDGQAQRALDKAIEKATNEYIAEQLGSELAPTLLRYDVRTIKEGNLKERYHDEARYPDPVGLMHEHFARLEFDPKFRAELDSRWKHVRAASRLGQTGLVSGAVLLLVMSVFGYFRLDNATRGYYTGRLQFMTAAAILAVVGGGALVARFITWL